MPFVTIKPPVLINLILKSILEVLYIIHKLMQLQFLLVSLMMLVLVNQLHKFNEVQWIAYLIS